MQFKHLIFITLNLNLLKFLQYDQEDTCSKNSFVQTLLMEHWQ